MRYEKPTIARYATSVDAIQSHNAGKTGKVADINNVGEDKSTSAYEVDE